MRISRRFLLPLGLTLGWFGLSFAAAAEISVFAAASLAEALKEIAASHQRATGDTVRLNLAASSLLARQIKEGAPADLFFSADEAKMNDLAKAGLIDAASRRSLLGNRLVIVVPLDSPLALGSAADLAGPAVTHLALAETATVPAGIYAKQYLLKIKIWDAVAARVVSTENVRAALAAVESGNADAGIVYQTDALISKKVRIAFQVTGADVPDISYPVALVKGGKNPAGAALFLTRLTSAEGRAVFTRFGFTPLP
ncbi:MAG: molybdate transport system substrate-binding protein [Verrucomicrobia bacterium]|jgi:molybdate transport system substrate-binding protein|nr:MAG: molybdate transport system substrate-binding protein [Verrucomicrobiota bacterium]